MSDSTDRNVARAGRPRRSVEPPDASNTAVRPPGAGRAKPSAAHPEPASEPSDERLRAILDSHPSAVVVVDRSGRISWANSRTSELLGYSPGELVGMPVDLLVPEASRSGHALDRGSYVADPVTRQMGAGRDLTARCKDGRLVPVEIGLSSFGQLAGTDGFLSKPFTADGLALKVGQIVGAARASRR